MGIFSLIYLGIGNVIVVDSALLKTGYIPQKYFFQSSGEIPNNVESVL